MIVLVLVKRFPSHLFAKTHTWLAALYLLLVFHSVVLTQFRYWGGPLGWVLATLMAAGSLSAVMVLAGQAGAGRRVAGMVEALVHYPELDVLETRVATLSGWPGHAAGQFTFVTSDRREGAHPFTIASGTSPRRWATTRAGFVVNCRLAHPSRSKAPMGVSASKTAGRDRSGWVRASGSHPSWRG